MYLPNTATRQNSMADLIVDVEQICDGTLQIHSTFSSALLFTSGAIYFSFHHGVHGQIIIWRVKKHYLIVKCLVNK